MKKILIMFVVSVLLLAWILGQCSNDSTDYIFEEDLQTEVYDYSESGNLDLKSHLVETSTPSHIDNITVETLGNPIMTGIVPEQILKRSAYIVSYNKNLKCPNWVYWYLSSNHTDGPYARSNDYREDNDVPAPRATNDDYKGSSWSRGHMCPAGDNKWDAEAMSETFFLTNMCPQNRSLNSGFWNRVEMDCRKWAQKYGGVYIVCGPLFYNKEHETIGSNNVVVPEAFYKVVLCLEGKPKGIGFIVKNNEGTKKKDQYVNTIDDVERITGIDFFPALPDSLENVVEAYANLEDWR